MLGIDRGVFWMVAVYSEAPHPIKYTSESIAR